MMFELVKNSLRAVQERFMNSDKHAPPVRIIVADGAEDVTIKVCLSPRLYSLFCESQASLRARVNLVCFYQCTFLYIYIYCK